MKNSTFSAQVANNLLTLLQGYSKTIRLLLVMFLTLTASTAWGESIEINTTNSKVNGSYRDYEFDVNSITFGCTQWMKNNNIQAKKSITNSLYNVDAIPGTITSIVVKQTGTARAIKIYGGTASKPTTQIKSPTTALEMTFDFTGKNYTYFSLTTPSNACYFDKITINYTPSGGGSTPDPCTTPTVAWNTKPANGEVGGSMTASVTTNYSNGLTYSSSNQTVATVNNAGVINYLSAGTTTITATVTGDGTTFCEGPVSVQQGITVTAPAGGDGSDGECSWTLVADASTLKVDDEIIIAASGDNNYALSTNQKSSNRGGTPITKNGNTLTAPSADVQILTLKAGSTSGTFAFYTGASGYLYAASSSGNQLKTKSTLDVHGSWTISITDGVASIAATGSSNRNVMQYNYNNGSPLFACYASASQTSLAIYKKICSDDGGGDPEPTKTLTSIEITTPATQTTFWQGETFNHNGLVVTAHYSDAEDEIITPTVTGSTATAGTATVTVSYKEQSTSYAITVKAIPNTKETAYSVAEAYDIIDKLTTAEGVFISGIISQVDSYNSTYKSITYWISADGTTTNQLQVYSGKGLESADFDAVTDLTVGDKVIVCGNLKKYSGTYEFDKNNYLASHTPTTKDPAGLAYATTSYTANVGEAFTTPELTNPHNLVVTYSTSDASKATVNENTGAVTIIAAGTVTITASTMGDARHEPGSASYTITIVNPAMAVATLPFTFNSGKADIENTAGMTQNGLGSDYSANTAPNSQLKFDGTGDWVVIRFDSEPEKLSYDIKNNSFSGGTFSVQESADGETYTDVEVHTEITNTQNEEHTLLSTSRYVKFIYTEKVDGNVGLGNIKITKPDPRQEAGIAWSTESIEITVGEDFTPPTLSNPNGLTLTCTSNNEDLVTVTNAGVITLKESVTGTAIITATFAGNKDYKQAEVSCTITVKALTTYTVTFDKNGHGTTTTQTINSGEKATEPKAPTATGYTFGGWYTEAECTNLFNFNTAITGHITLYAKWTLDTYTVTFDAGSGTCATEPTQGNFATGITLPTATPCPYASTNGWSFVGWSESTVSETTVRPAIHTGNYKPTKTITLHAVYAKTGAGQGAEGEFILSLEYKGTTYYVGQTFDNNKLSAEAEQTNAARFTIEDNYLHYEGGYISHVSTSGSTNITRQANKEDARAWTIADNGSTITFTSTADETRGLGFNYNDGSPRFAAYKLNEKEKDGETIKYPSTFTKTSVSDAAIDVTTYNSNPSCEAPIDPTWDKATIDHNTIQVACGSKTQLGAAAPNGPATITFNGYDLVNPVTVTASEDFLVSTDKVNDAGYKSEVTITPHKEGQNVGKLQNVYVIAQAPAQSGDFTGTITLTGADITGGSQVIKVTADVTCTTYTITWSVNGDTEIIEPTTFYAGGEWTLPENPTFDCNGREFVGWTDKEILKPQNTAPVNLYKNQLDFPKIESSTTFYAVFAIESDSDGNGSGEEELKATLDFTDNSSWKFPTTKTTSSATYTDNNGISITLGGVTSNGWAWYDNGTYFLYGEKGCYIQFPAFNYAVTKFVVTGRSGASSKVTQNIFVGENAVSTATTGATGENTYVIANEYQAAGNIYSLKVTSAHNAQVTNIKIYGPSGNTSSTTYTSYTTSCADVKAIRIVEPTTKTFKEGDKFVFDGKVWAINSDDSETDVTNSPLVHFDVDMHKVGEQTVTVSYLSFTATYKITINEVEKWQITWNVSGATNTGLGPKEVAKGTAIGKLPQPKEIPAGCTGKEFRGWTKSNTVNSDGTEITFITSSTIPTQNTTYYAVFARPSGNAGDGDYIKVTEDANDLSGEYLIVYEAGNLAFNGGLETLDAVGNTIAVTISNNTIASTDATDAAKFTIAKDGEGDYTIKSASGKYIGKTANDNDLEENESTPYKNTITFTDGDVNIIASGGAYLRYNNTSNQLRFRYYKSDTYTNQQPIALYKKSGSSASYTDYTTGCHDVTITYYGFKGGYTTNCGGSDLNVITQRVNSAHTIPTCTEISDPTTLGRTFLNLWKDQNGKVHQPGESFIVTQDTTLYAQWKLETTGDIELPADKEDLATTDIVVTGGKTLTIPEGKTITINSLTLKGGLLVEDDSVSGYAMPVVNIPTGATLVRKNTTINLDLVVNSDSWYPFAVPFALDKNDNIDYLDPVLKAAATYNKHFAIKTYDGENRAKVGTDQENNWDKVPQAAGLQPGKGYIISALTYPDKDTATIRIPMSVPNEWLANGEQTTVNDVTRNAVAVTAYTGAAATEHQRHAGWNFVANPYLSNFTGGGIDATNGLDYIDGKLIIQGSYEYSKETVPYVTIPAYNFAYYSQYKLSEAPLSPAYSFFVQVGTDGTMTFETAGRQQAPASIAARNAEERPVKMDVDITLSDNHSSDQTGIIISDRYSDAYEIGRDLEKLFGSAYNLSVYTLMADNTPLAYQALAIRSNMQVIPVGYRTPAQGEYTFRLNEATSSIDLLNEQYEQLVLVDYQTGELTNLLISDYTFYSERTQADNRFAIYAVPRQNAPTDLPNAIGQDKQAQKIIHNGHLYILRDGSVYNGNGQIVK